VSIEPEPESAGAAAEATVDLRVLTPGLTPEEIAAVTSVVTALVEEQRGAAARDTAPREPRWRHAVEPFGDRSRGPRAWRWAGR